MTNNQRFTARRLFLALALLGGPMACDSAATTQPSADYACINPLIPAAAFRIVILRTSGPDTSARYVNRYLEPHRWADTVPFRDPQGKPVPGYNLVIRDALGEQYCMTLMDSIAHHTLEDFTAFEIP